MYVVSVPTAQTLKKPAPGTKARADSSVERAPCLLLCLSPEMAKRGHTRLSWWPQSVRAHPPSPSLAPESFWTHSPWQPHQSVDSGRRPPRSRSRRRAGWRGLGCGRRASRPCGGGCDKDPVRDSSLSSHFTSSPARASQPGRPPDRNRRCSARRRGRRGCGGLCGAAGGCKGPAQCHRQRQVQDPQQAA